MGPDPIIHYSHAAFETLDSVFGQHHRLAPRTGGRCTPSPITLAQNGGAISRKILQGTRNRAEHLRQLVYLHKVANIGDIGSRDLCGIGHHIRRHVVSGKVMSKDVAGMTEATTVQGEKVKIDASNGVMINNAKVVTADIECSNGIIHVIDTVLMP